MMKRFRAFVLKEFRHILRDTRTLSILLLMPIVLVLLFGFAITTEVTDAEIAILDHSRDELTDGIKDKLLSSSYFNIDRTLRSNDEILPAFQNGTIDLVIVFAPDFEEKFRTGQSPRVQLIGDATNPNNSNQLIGYVSSIINSYQKGLRPDQSMPLPINTSTRMLYNPELESSFYFVPGVITVILMLISALMTSVTIAREKEYGNMEVLLASPMQPGIVILGKTIPYIALSLINAFTILLLGYFVFNMPISGQPVLLLFELLLFIVTSLALGILISTVTKTQQSALMISLVGLMLPTILLSGFIFPIESMPQILQWISHLVPAKWFIIVIKDIMLKGVGLSIIWPETLILGGMTLVLLSISIMRFNIRLE